MNKDDVLNRIEYLEREVSMILSEILELGDDVAAAIDEELDAEDV